MAAKARRGKMLKGKKGTRNFHFLLQHCLTVAFTGDLPSVRTDHIKQMYSAFQVWSTHNYLRHETYPFETGTAKCFSTILLRRETVLFTGETCVGSQCKSRRTTVRIQSMTGLVFDWYSHVFAISSTSVFTRAGQNLNVSVCRGVSEYLLRR